MPKRKAVAVPAVLQMALKKNPTAAAYFESLPPSHQREYVKAIAEAKRPETVARRVAWTLAELEKGKWGHSGR